MSYYEEVRGQGEVASDGWRHRLEQWLRFEAVVRGLGVGSSDSVLDLGCGTGAFLEYLSKGRSGEYLGVDLYERDEWIRSAADEGRRFLHADAFAPAGFRCLDGELFDVAVAIGTLVGSERRSLADWMARLQKLAARWALVVLDQERLDANPLRSLDEALCGASPMEIALAAEDLGLSVVVVDSLLPSDLFVFGGISKAPDDLSVESCVKSVFDRAESKLEDQAWLYLILERWSEAFSALSGVAPAERGRRWWLLRERLLNAGHGDPAI